METSQAALACALAIIVRFPLGSGINGNGRSLKYYKIWFFVRFPLGSGINGNEEEKLLQFLKIQEGVKFTMVDENKKMNVLRQIKTVGLEIKQSQADLRKLIEQNTSLEEEITSLEEEIMAFDPYFSSSSSEKEKEEEYKVCASLWEVESIETT